MATRRASSRLKKALTDASSSEDPATVEAEGELTESAAKRKRARTVGKSAQPAAKRPAVAPPDAPTSDDELLAPPVDVPPRVYGTRRTNDPHPARTAGIEKRTQVEVQKDAAVKKAEKKAKSDAKQQSQREESERETRGMTLLAELLDSYQATNGMLLDGNLQSASGLRSRLQSLALAGNEDASSFLRLDEERSANIGGDGNDSLGDERTDDAEYGTSENVSKSKTTGQPSLSAKDKRSRQQERIWEGVDSRRDKSAVASASTTPSSKSGTLNMSQGRRITSLPSAGLQTDWRARLRESGPQLTSEPVATTSKVVTSHAARRADERVEGFDDAAVATPRPALRTTLGAQSAKRSAVARQLVAFVEDDPVEAVGSVTKKPSRAARTELAPDKSLALKYLAQWMRDELDPNSQGRIIATIIDFYGCQRNPWNFDYNAAEVFLTLLQCLVDHLYPEEHYTVTRGDQLYKRARQAVYDVRARMARAAVAYMNARVKGAPSADVQNLVKKALSKDGELYYGNTKLKIDVFQAPGVLFTFAEHLKSTKKSILATPHFQDILHQNIELGNLNLHIDYPQGALTLAVCAMQRVYTMYATGSFVPIQTGFTEEYMKEGGDESMWEKHLTTVDDVYMRPDKPHRFEQLLDKANKYVDSRAGVDPLKKPKNATNTTFSVDVMSSPVLGPASESGGAVFDDDDNELLGFAI